MPLYVLRVLEAEFESGVRRGTKDFHLKSIRDTKIGGDDPSSRVFVASRDGRAPETYARRRRCFLI